MLKLSRPAWNNVLIVSTLIMILAFNGVHKKLLSNAEESMAYLPLVEQGELVLTIDYGQFQIERIGKDWRVTGDRTLPVDRINKAVQSWQGTQGKPLNEQQQVAFADLLKEPPWVVTLWLAGEDSGQVVELFFQQQQLIIRTRGATLLLPADSFKDLMPHA